MTGAFSYLAETNLLEVIDVSLPNTPRRVGAYAASASLSGVALAGHYACLAEGTNGLVVLDVSSPINPRRVGGCATRKPGHAVAVMGNYAYLTGWGSYGTNGLGGLEVIDISNPADPRRVGGNSSFAYPSRAATVAGWIFVAAGRDGLVVLNRYQAPPPHFESQRLDPIGFHLFLRGEAGRTLRLQRSLDLSAWEDWVVLPATGDQQEVVDPGALSHPSQFYRAAVP